MKSFENLPWESDYALQNATAPPASNQSPPSDLQMLSNGAWMAVYQTSAVLNVILSFCVVAQLLRLISWRRQGANATTVRILFHALLTLCLLLNVVSAEFDAYLLYHYSRTLGALDFVLDSIPTLIFISIFSLAIGLGHYPGLKPFNFQLYVHLNIAAYIVSVAGYIALLVTEDSPGRVETDTRIVYCAVTSLMFIAFGLFCLWVGWTSRRMINALPGDPVMRARIVHRVLAITWLGGAFFLLHGLDVWFPLLIVKGSYDRRYTSLSMARYVFDFTVLGLIPSGLMAWMMYSTRATHFMPTTMRRAVNGDPQQAPLLYNMQSPARTNVENK